MIMPDRKTSILTTFSWIVLPQLILISLLVTYLLLGAVVFRAIDEDLSRESLMDIILFEYGTLTTIGYGNIYPKNDHSRLFAVIFATFGIPINLLTLANLGKYITKGYWYMLYVLGWNVRSKVSSDAKLPIPVILILFAFTFAAGAFFVSHTGEKFSIDDIYFSFISFTTVGFGDKVPTVPSAIQLFITVLYLTWGIILTSALFSVLNDYLKKVHYLGRRFTGARDVPVWMGGQCMTVSELLSVVANEFNASPKEIRAMLRDLDGLISAATEEVSPDGINAPIANNIEDFDCFE